MIPVGLRHSGVNGGHIDHSVRGVGRGGGQQSRLLNQSLWFREENLDAGDAFLSSSLAQDKVEISRGR